MTENAMAQCLCVQSGGGEIISLLDDKYYKKITDRSIILHIIGPFFP